MVRYEKGYHGLHVKIFSVPTGKDGTSETSSDSTPFTYSRMEVGTYYMDFVIGLPRTQAGHDAIWVIVDRLTKLAHFLAIRNNFSLDKLAKLYISEIIKLYGVPTSIVSNRDPRFTSRFWPKL